MKPLSRGSKLSKNSISGSLESIAGSVDEGPASKKVCMVMTLIENIQQEANAFNEKLISDAGILTGELCGCSSVYALRNDGVLGSVDVMARCKDVRKR